MWSTIAEKAQPRCLLDKEAAARERFAVEIGAVLALEKP